MSSVIENSHNLPKQPVLFFDGVCGLCNHLVNITFRLDKQQAILFTPLQGELANATLPPMEDDARDWSMVFWNGEQLFVKSDATLELCRELGGLMKLFVVFRIVPEGLRDAIYMAFARTRYGWFGVKESCRVPSEEERARFLP